MVEDYRCRGEYNRDKIRSLRGSREGPQEEVSRGDGKQPRTGLAEKMSTSGAQGISGGKIKNKRRAETGSLALFLKDA